MQGAWRWLMHVDATHWWALGLILMIAELATGTTYLLWPAVAAGLTGFFHLVVAPSLIVDIAVFAGLTIVLTLVGRPLARARLNTPADGPILNERARSLVGAQAHATGGFVDGHGEVKLGDSVWRARSETPIAAHAPVEVVAVDGAVLVVRPR